MSAFPRSVGPLAKISDQAQRTSLTLWNWSADKLSVSIEMPKSSKVDYVDTFSGFFEEGAQESTTETLFTEQRNDLGGTFITRADKLQNLTGSRTVLHGPLREPTLGQTVRSPSNEVSICSLTAVSNSPVLRAMP